MSSNREWDYGGVFKKYDMSGEIKIGTGIVKVHDIYDPLPAFMKTADLIFCDPPCNSGNLSSFYTKAEIGEESRPFTKYDQFTARLFECVDEIDPHMLIMELFKSNFDVYLFNIRKRYRFVKIYESMYYHNPKNRCKIVIGSNVKFDGFDAVDGIDEEDAIHFICKNAEYDVIGDPCMGKGLVGYYSNLYGRKFVGTELNAKRLAVLLERITTNSRGKIN